MFHILNNHYGYWVDASDVNFEGEYFQEEYTDRQTAEEALKYFVEKNDWTWLTDFKIVQDSDLQINPSNGVPYWPYRLTKQ